MVYNMSEIKIESNEREYKEYKHIVKIHRLGYVLSVILYIVILYLALTVTPVNLKTIVVGIVFLILFMAMLLTAYCPMPSVMFEELKMKYENPEAYKEHLRLLESIK